MTLSASAYQLSSPVRGFCVLECVSLLWVLFLVCLTRISLLFYDKKVVLVFMYLKKKYIPTAVSEYQRLRNYVNEAGA